MLVSTKTTYFIPHSLELWIPISNSPPKCSSEISQHQQAKIILPVPILVYHLAKHTT